MQRCDTKISQIFCQKGKAIIGSKTTAQQSVHPTLGSLARFQAFFYASAFSQSDGVPPPAPARVTQTVETVEKVGN
jgi:hypothetical protein